MCGFIEITNLKMASCADSVKDTIKTRGIFISLVLLSAGLAGAAEVRKIDEQKPVLVACSVCKSNILLKVQYRETLRIMQTLAHEGRISESDARRIYSDVSSISGLLQTKVSKQEADYLANSIVGDCWICVCGDVW